jgi:ATP-dependent DNA helicase PIF1
MSASKRRRRNYRQGAPPAALPADLAEEEAAVAQQQEMDAAELSPMQTKAEALALARENVLLLGPGGTGKSFLIRRLVQKLRAMGLTVAVTAMTGLAAFNVGGGTLHSFAGVGLGEGTLEELIKRVRVRPYSRNNWRNTDVLIIDEISMLSAELCTTLDEIGRVLRRSDEPWGGLQVIGCGDFLQLPPVRAKYCFESDAFHATFSARGSLVFERNFRQGSDPLLQRILTEVRNGDLSAESVAILEACTRKVVPPHLNIDPVHVFPRCKEVEWHNIECMAKLDGPEHKYKHRFLAADGMPKKTKDKLQFVMLKSAPCCDELVLKIGGQVMFVCNDRRIQKHNGSMGIVTAFEPRTNLPVVTFEDGMVHTIGYNSWETPDHKARITQIPLIQAFALTVHKIQGATLECARISVGRSLFEYNQMYVALSRLRTLAGLFLLHFDASKAMAHPDAVKYYTDLTARRAALATEAAKKQQQQQQQANNTETLGDEEFVVVEASAGGGGGGGMQTDIRAFFQ